MSESTPPPDSTRTLFELQRLSAEVEELNILLYDPTSHNKVYTGMWDESFSYSLKDEGNVGAWTSCIAKTFSFGGLLKLHPTHWMPLPQAP